MKNKIIFHGSPCQDFSLAGKQAGGDKDSGTRSSLLYETIRIVSKLRPKYVIWENVKNVISQKHKHNFDNYLNEMKQLGYSNYYQVLNAKDYGIPQNRERVFTISILQKNQLIIGSTQKHASIRNDGICPSLTSAMGMGGGQIPMIFEKKFNFPLKQELKLRLKDLLEENVDEKYYLSDKMLACMTDMTDRNGFVRGKRFNPLSIESKYAYTVTTAAGNRPTDNFINEPICLNSKGGRGGIEGLQPSMQDRIYDEQGMSTAVTTSFMPSIAVREATKKGYKEAYIGDGINISSRMKYQRGNVQKESTQTITTSGGGDRGVVMNDLRIRKLTPKECWRLMGFDDVDFEKASKVNSNAQLYKQAGNSIVVNVLEAIFNSLLDKKEEYELIELFGGIGSPRKALQRQGFNFKTIDYVEIDKYAVKSYNAIFNENYEPKDIKNS